MKTRLTSVDQLKPGDKIFKVDELMVGDWVTNNPLDEEPFNTQWERDDFAQGYYEGQFTPIPLTKEILEFNGFSDDTYMILELDENTSIEMCVDDKYFLETPVYVETKFWRYCFPHITYVHELQHLLRLCGLGKLADNFKIE